MIINKPLVSIITPTYNCSNYIKDTIESVLNQTYQNWEMIVVDDLSRDDTLDIVRIYAKQDARIRVFSLKEKGGASIARNFAINKANGMYIAFLDGDDLWLPEKLEKQICFMNKYNYVFTYTNYYIMQSKFVDNKKRLLPIQKCPQKVAYKEMLKRNYIGCLTVMFDAEKVGKINIPRLDKRNDYALWLKILQKGFEAHLLDESLAIYRNHQGLSHGSKFKLLKYHYQVFKKVLGYHRIKALFFTARNLFYYCLELSRKVLSCKF